MTSDLPTSSSKLPRRREVTQERLVASAEHCFLERGFHGSSVDWLAAVAGYTPGAIYSSFGDKAGLFMAVLDRRNLVRQKRWRTAAAAEDPEREVGKMLEELLADDKAQQWASAYYEFVAFAVRDPELKSVLEDRMRAAVSELEAALEPLARHSSMPLDDFARIVFAASNGLLLISLHDHATEVSRLMATVLSRLRD